MNQISSFRSFLICGICILTACTMGPEIKDGTVITTNATVQGNKTTLRFTRGPHFSHSKQIGFTKMVILPQMAVWTEDTLGNYLQTLYVTRKLAQQYRGAASKETFLPYWLNKHIHAPNTVAGSNESLPDGITSATPAGCFDLVTTVDSSPVDIVVRAEVNSYFDYNEAFGPGRRESKINGQPAVVYSARINLQSGLFPAISMELAGHSGETAADSILYRDVSKLTTAKRIFDCIHVLLPPAKTP